MPSNAVASGELGLRAPGWGLGSKTVVGPFCLLVVGPRGRQHLRHSRDLMRTCRCEANADEDDHIKKLCPLFIWSTPFPRPHPAAPKPLKAKTGLL